MDREVEIAGRRLRLTNLEKVMYPAAGFTKGDVIDYYRRIAPVIVPHLERRPLTLKRFPDGVHGGYFFEKRCPHYRPDWLGTHPIWIERYGEHFEFCLANDEPSIVWLANLANLEMHPALARTEALDRPTALAFDLDPGYPAGLQEAAELALVLNGMLERLGLSSRVKTSGSKGVHVYVPIAPRVGYAETKGFARAVAETLAAQFPDHVVAETKRSRRAGKVLVDWGQNDHNRTIVAPYSLRAKDDPAMILETPRVSTPVSWDELEQATREHSVERLAVGAEEALARVERLGDLFADAHDGEQELPELSGSATR